MQRVGRWWGRVATFPTRVLLERLSVGLPKDAYNGIELLVPNRAQEGSAQRFFERTRGALQIAKAMAPGAYAQLVQDVRRVVLWDEPAASPYHPFQIAILVPLSIAFDSVPACYAAWLLWASGRSRNHATASARSHELLAALPVEERASVAAWLDGVAKQTKA